MFQWIPHQLDNKSLNGMTTNLLTFLKWQSKNDNLPVIIRKTLHRVLLSDCVMLPAFWCTYLAPLTQWFSDCNVHESYLGCMSAMQVPSFSHMFWFYFSSGIVPRNLLLLNKHPRTKKNPFLTCVLFFLGNYFPLLPVGQSVQYTKSVGNGSFGNKN